MRHIDLIFVKAFIRNLTRTICSWKIGPNETRAEQVVPELFSSFTSLLPRAFVYCIRKIIETCSAVFATLFFLLERISEAIRGNYLRSCWFKHGVIFENFDDIFSTWFGMVFRFYVRFENSYHHFDQIRRWRPGASREKKILPPCLAES